MHALNIIVTENSFKREASRVYHESTAPSQIAAGQAKGLFCGFGGRKVVGCEGCDLDDGGGYGCFARGLSLCVWDFMMT